jgi:hypothetical protein
VTIAEYARFEAESLPAELRREFDRMVQSGTTPQCAMMLISRTAPKMSHSDRAFGEGAMRRMNGMREKSREKIVEIASRAGISTNGKYYQGQLGRYTDKRAWVSTDSDVLESCKAQNLGCDGTVKHKRREVPPVQGPPLAPNLVKRYARKMVSEDPKLAEQVRTGKVKKQEVCERVIAKHGKKRLVF